MPEAISPAAPLPAPSPGAAIAVQLGDVTKTYRLYSGPTEQALDVLGLTRFMPWRKIGAATFKALDGVSLEVRQGERVGIIGRNGAGKTTLLKLISGNFTPSSGRIEVNGRVQALMQTGLGFHPEFTGYENLRSALLYNGLVGREFEEALADVVDFVELGEFLHQPFKTYSLGMRSRLQFAAATAIKPEILIVDEVLGAGDAYFSAKSALRMKELTASGCTLLLVSHSMAQILQFCDRVVWIEAGRVVQDGAALPVVRAYEEFSRHLEHEAERARALTGRTNILQNDELRRHLLEQALARSDSTAAADGSVETSDRSRWPSVGGLKITDVSLHDAMGAESWMLRSGEPAEIRFTIQAETAGPLRCCYVVVLFTEDGRVVTRHCSKFEEFVADPVKPRVVRLKYPRILLGDGRYIFSAALYKELDLANVNSAVPYDLLSRAFEFRVFSDNRDDPTLVHLPAEWIGSMEGVE